MSFELHEVGTVHLQDLNRLWRNLDEAERGMELEDRRYSCNAVVSARRFDEQTQTGQRLYIHARGYIVAARQNHKAMIQMIVDRGVTPHAPWSLIRASLENAFYAVWLLEPDAKEERFRRGLRLAWKQHRDAEFRSEMLRDIASIQEIPVDSDAVMEARRQGIEIAQRLKNESKNLGMKEGILTCSPKVSNELQKISLGPGLPTWLGKFTALVWRQLSGVVHGDEGALMTLMDITNQIEISGGWNATLSVSDDAFRMACNASGLIQLRAMDLYRERTVST